MDSREDTSFVSFETSKHDVSDLDHNVEASDPLLSHTSIVCQSYPRPRFLPLGVLSILSWRAFESLFSRRARHSPKFRTGHWLHKLGRLLLSFLCFLLTLVIFFGLFLPSYTRLPPHYAALRGRVEDGWQSGSANVNQEKVFIAASLFDPGGTLARGEWAKDVSRLIHILGPSNVYLSIYENDSGSEGREALLDFERTLSCNHTLLSEMHLRLEEPPQIQLPNGTSHVKRIAYLAEVRNRALRPLTVAPTHFDKLLYLNDVVFDPIDAAQLLFSTNVDANGKARYRSACAVDFSMPFKFYDTFATRDSEGYSMGVPFFPWFVASGKSETRDDVLLNKDAVRVRSCWGGMVAFDARFFQNWSDEALAIPTLANQSPLNTTAPYQFRALGDLWWDASECCLIQADIQSPDPLDPEVYMNPFVRVAYDAKTLSWLWFTRRFEKLYNPIHLIANMLAGLPRFNPRRSEVPWQLVEEPVWFTDSTLPENGTWRNELRTAGHDGFCGRSGISIMKPNLVAGEKNYEFVPPPAHVP